jgi:UDP-N-acetyl-D-mannosaminuronic acid dehydrogenase
MMGLGYIGLPTAAIMASSGLKVHGVDVTKRVVDTINQGKIHIVEPSLAELVAKVVSEGKLVASTTPVKAGTFIVAVPTPFKDDHQPDISFVESATRMTIPYLTEGSLFVLESTSPVGTTEKMADIIYAERPELKGKIYIAYCPERVLPGNVLYELVNNERSIGGIDEASTVKAKDFYAKFVKANLNPTNARTAEMCKLVENSYRDVNIAFANELSILADKFGVNVWELIKLANKHPRVKILTPGCGVGGHCIAVDPWFLVADGQGEAKVIKAARERNDSKAVWVLDKIKAAEKDFEKKNGRKPIIACMGLAFKPNIDDLRESPALEIAEWLKRDGYNLIVSEPNIESHVDFKLVAHEEAIEKADIIVYLVAHKEYFNLKEAPSKVVLDFCGIRV